MKVPARAFTLIGPVAQPGFNVKGNRASDFYCSDAAKAIRWSRVRIPSGPLMILRQKPKKPRIEGCITNMKKKFDITKHQLVPKHVKVSEKEKAELLKRYNITIKELPKILIEDPALENLDVKVDDVVKIMRKSSTAGEVVFYRCVTHG